MVETGKFVCLYGVNNLGKTGQRERLQNALEQRGLEVVSIKYPIYDLMPTGPTINAVLRQGLEMEELDLQRNYAQNRKDFEPTLRGHLSHGIWVVAEDYTGTGIAWGMAGGISLSEMEEINAGLLDPDLEILFDGERFLQGREENHRNEANDERCVRARTAHLLLSERYGWRKIFANRPKDEVHQEIWQIVAEKFGL